MNSLIGAASQAKRKEAAQFVCGLDRQASHVIPATGTSIGGFQGFA